MKIPALSAQLLLFLTTAHLPAMTITGYTAAANDRFSSGYPTAPVENTTASFVGLGLDWGGVGWASTAATKSFGFLSPSHYLVARHFGGAANIRIFANGTLQTYAQTKIEDTGFGVVFSGETLGDISLGTLSGPVPASGGLPRYAVLDLNSTSASNTTSAYNGLQTLLYGRGPNATSSTRVGVASINSVTVSGNNHYFTTTRSDVQLETGDSGSPATHRWTNPNGSQELTLIGNHAGINDTNNFINFLGTYQVMNELNARMNDDGFALRVVGNPTNTWVGSSSTNISNRGAWGLSQPNNAPSDKFVTFNAATAGNNRQVTVDTNHNLRGLYFLSTATANDGFTFGGSSALTLGRGGVTNYDNSRQVFNASLVLGDSQYWDGGSGGVTAGAINTNGKLLEITGSGVNRITGTISGTGSLAVSGGTLELTGANSYSGETRVHSGTLVLNNLSGSATGTGTLRVAAGATLAGAGFSSSSSIISGALSPGNSIGTLTIANDVTWNGGVPWLFELDKAAATFAAAAMGGSSQDLLYITGVESDFLKGSGSVWTFDFFSTGENGWYRLVDWEGATTFSASDFTAMNLSGGKSGSFFIDDTTSALYFNVIPEPSVALLFLTAVVHGCFRRRRK
jgi:autotransporter-associated beta strand protein